MRYLLLRWILGIRDLDQFFSDLGIILGPFDRGEGSIELAARRFVQTMLEEV